MSDGLPIAASWAPDLRTAIRGVCARAAPWLAAMHPPLGAPPLDPMLLAFAHDVPEAPHPSAFRAIMRALDLDDVEELIVAAAISPDVDVRIGAMWQVLGRRIDVCRPRLSSLVPLVDPVDVARLVDALAPTSALRLLGLIDLDGSRAMDSVVAPSPALLALVAGGGVAVRCAPRVTPVAVDAALEAALRSPIVRARSGASPTVIAIVGPAGSGRDVVANALAGAVERSIVRGSATNSDRALGTVIATAIVDQCIPCIAVDAGDPVQQERIVRVASSYAGPLIAVAESRPTLPAAWRSFSFATTRPNAARRADLWAAALPVDYRSLAIDLAERYPIGVGATFAAAADAVMRSAGNLDARSAAQAAREQLDVRSSIAERSRASYQLADLIAPPQTIALIEEVIGFARHRRTVLDDWGFARRHTGGLKVLFSGPPGTGKTMSAEIIAGELALDLFKIDLSLVVSKWAGETEKNLAEVFDQAEDVGGVLLFDEADALFGKRTPGAKTANDRYANLEINYLLQRMETFDGIVVLTTNLETSLDEAFQRRLNFRIRFHAPDVDERARLWQQMVPSMARRGGPIDFAEVARRFDMAGGSIKNAAIRAAVLAASEASSLQTRHLLDAAAREFAEIGRIGFESASSLS